jgi:2-isopropylmalate synthase
MPKSHTPAALDGRIRKPSGPIPQRQPWWNPQRTSSMPTRRYVRPARRVQEALPSRSWPERSIDHAPLWCSVDLRDGNQSLPNPMDPRRKGAIFDLLVEMGFKEIEVGYPSASETDFGFVADLVRADRVPDDVTIAVFTPARTELIDRTFEAIRGTDRAIVHLCLATACLWREVVFGMSAAELQRFTIAAAEHVARLADAIPRSRLRFEYSPETFNVTEPEFALEISTAVMSAWDACPARPVILNLPSTVETDSPNVYADQIEWMHRNLGNRESVILSVHPHNDRGTAVASAELALMAGADRVEGTLFGNGERTGNVCLGTLALNLFSEGVDPQLDFSDIDTVRRIVEFCNQMPVHPRHPYAGDLVYTAFSGTHQDAIAKGLAAMDAAASRTGRFTEDLPWQVPYLPIDPHDVGRTYESVVRVNSQSGKGGIAHILRNTHGLDLPRALRIEFARIIQKITDDTGAEVNSRQLWDIFRDEYMTLRGPFLLVDFREDRRADEIRLETELVLPGGARAQLTASGTTVNAAYLRTLTSTGYPINLLDISAQPVRKADASETAVYAHIGLGQVCAFGVGLDRSSTRASLNALTAAANRALGKLDHALPAEPTDIVALREVPADESAHRIPAFQESSARSP